MEMKITVSIEETVCQDFTVEANSLEEAMEIAEKKYYDGEFVVNSCDCTSRQMSATDGKKFTDWREF